MSIAGDRVLGGLDAIMSELEDLYRDIHAHPELSMQERRTAGVIAGRPRDAGYDVTEGVGGTGVVGLLANGEGPTVMLRADMDALPIREATGLPYASTVTAMDADGHSTPVMHGCDHDMHVTWLAGAIALLARSRDAWHGTVLAVFQPAEETARGAQAMIGDGLFDRFPKPDVILGQHVMPAPAGEVGYRTGTTQAAADSLEVRLFGTTLWRRPTSPRRSAPASAGPACTSLRWPTRPARTSARSAPNGVCRRCSGTSAAPTPRSTAGLSWPAASPRTSRPTTTRASPR
jgi:metal-dependent amidase/aminoacylase/carboxypeptidase family protein